MKAIELTKTYSPLLDTEVISLYAAMRYYGEEREVLADNIVHFANEQEAIWCAKSFEKDINSEICIEKISFPTSKVHIFEWDIDFSSGSDMMMYFAKKYKIGFKREEFYKL